MTRHVNLYVCNASIFSNHVRVCVCMCVCMCVSLTYQILLLMSGHCRKLNASNSIEIKM